MRPVSKFADKVPYQLLRPIAQGGMGCVYEALQEGSDGFRKRVAIKIIRQEYSQLPLFRKNFIGEAQLVADLIHANIVQTYHLGHAHNQYYMVMEYVRGVNLEQFMLQHRALDKVLPWDLAAFVISRLSRALACAHDHCDANGKHLGIVHRDVSPKNIMLGESGDVKLTDFGIAKAFNLMYSKEGEIIAGRSDYLSPEQAHLEVTDPRADLFSCGVVLAEMLTGYNPFVGATPEESRDNICSMPLSDFEELLPKDGAKLKPILYKCLEREREKRYQSAKDLMVDLEKLLYAKGYGPTNEKLALYLKELYADGQAYVDDMSELPVSMALNPDKDE
ncbi:serine/threonine protein kinase [Puniceicoccales bacterium CK1056]|uniref:Serine/threonine protein kinase n=1 Tax=Oceanipulchritudo coccoides TaxID=2706888 RepID=A0A6B2M3Y5_9BACT|nr:serine/threonine-protein kinase [Oceanipulchritudo coccoides]NDV62535.1 serine/threonine protein kinase [Oceanipulchritudo coccoides]